MKICIFGAGVIGSILASGMARAGHEVSLIARGPHLDALRANGLTIATPEDVFVTEHQATNDPRDLGPQDLVIVAIKTPALATVARTIGPLLDDSTETVFAVNGTFWFYADGQQATPVAAADTARLDPENLLHQAIDIDRASGMVCKASGDIEVPGRVEMTRPRGSFTVGPALPHHFARLNALFAELHPPNLDIDVVQDIRTPMWAKHIAAVGNMAISTLTGGTTAETQAIDDLQDLRLELMAEASAVASAHGYGDTGFDRDRERSIRSSVHHKPSMLQDLERGRPMEIESQFLILQDFARQAGIATPLLDIVVPMIELRAKLAQKSP